MDKLINRPGKCLGLKTPNEVFFGTKPGNQLSCCACNLNSRIITNRFSDKCA